jgi:MEDS: MEthanogen/methylotroph, DcmR Sensory domain
MPESSLVRSGHFHAVRFYEDSAALSRIVADFLAEGIRSGQPALIIATRAHQESILARLRELSLDSGEAMARGDLFLADAADLLASFMVDGMPDGERFIGVTTDLLERIARGRVVRAYGEMVDVLWQAGMHAAAIRLEMLWNQLANSAEFSLLCGYSMGHFYKDAAYDDICSQHTHTISAEGQAGPLH